MRHIATVLLITSATGYLPGSVPLRWTVETSRVNPASFEAYQGETLELEAALQSKGKPLEAPLNYSFFWQTNGMGNTYWEKKVVVGSRSRTEEDSNSSVNLNLQPQPTNVLFATWSPEMDVGARVYNCFIGSPSNIYRAAFQLRLRPSPGATPNALPLPTPVIDFARVQVLNPPWGSGGGGGCDTNTVVLTNGTLRTLGGKEIKPTDVGALDESSLTPIKEDIKSAYAWSQNIYRYMTANTNAWFAGTNYVTNAEQAAQRHKFAFEDGMDLATVPCSMALWEIRDGVRQCVWDQRDWPTWYWSFKASQMQAEINASNALFRAEVNAAINSDEAHAWAKRYASTGRRNPDASTTFIDTPTVTLSPGMSWETVATVGGCGYWTIVGNGAVIGGSGTNATLNIKDFEGNSILEITKGQHMLAWLDSSDFVGQLTDADGWVCFDMMADVKPTGYFSTTLVAADFVVETDANCPAQYRWEDLGGHVWRVHFLLKPGIVSGACFAKFQVEVEGKTQIRYNADTVINGGLIFEGVKIAPVIQSGAAVGSTVTWKVVE